MSRECGRDVRGRYRIEAGNVGVMGHRFSQGGIEDDGMRRPVPGVQRDWPRGGEPDTRRTAAAVSADAVRVWTAGLEFVQAELSLCVQCLQRASSIDVL
jgi:hypothetical protein